MPEAKPKPTPTPIEVNITYSKGNNPPFAVDKNPIKMPCGKPGRPSEYEITWVLKGTTFAATNGIFFLPADGYGTWPPSQQPTPVPDANGKITYHTQHSVPYRKSKVLYKYRITDANENTHDPEAEAEGEGKSPDSKNRRELI